MDVFSNLMVVGECLLDNHRTTAFLKAIRTTVKPGDVVLDVGTGSGILAMAAARAGAKRVYAIDIADDIVGFAQKNVKNNHLEDIVNVKQVDAKTFIANEPIDVLTMELMDTWLIGEQQGIVMNMLHTNKSIRPKTRLMPHRYECALSLIHYDFDFYGFTMPFVIQARNFGVMERVKATFSDRVIANDIDFHQIVQTEVSLDVSVPVVAGGLCNAVLLESRTHLTQRMAIWGTSDMNMPVIVPMPEREVLANTSERVAIQYRMGEGYQTLDVQWV